MSKFMQIAGIVAAAAGVAIGLMVFFSLGQMQVLGLTPETSALLLVGGLLMIGLGGIIVSIDDSTRATRDLRDWLAGHEAPALAEQEPSEDSMDLPAAVVPVAAVSAVASLSLREREVERPSETLRGRAEAEAAAAGGRADEAIESSKAETEETLASLDRAKADIAKALDIRPEPEPAAERPPGPEEDAAEVEEGDEQLYVVEEKMIRGRPARVLSDGTVEAETDEGWMRFENLEHLEEYLDAMSPAKV